MSLFRMILVVIVWELGKLLGRKVDQWRKDAKLRKWKRMHDYERAIP